MYVLRHVHSYFSYPIRKLYDVQGDQLRLTIPFLVEQQYTKIQNIYNFCGKKISPIICAISVILTKTIQTKQSPNRQKFAQSGHPGYETAYSSVMPTWVENLS
jgi:hypothetical protein